MRNQAFEEGRITQLIKQVCTKMQKISSIEEIANEREDIKVGKINVDEQPELASKFGIMSIPTLVVMKNGKIVQQVSGARPKDAILGMLFNDTAAHTGKVER